MGNYDHGYEYDIKLNSLHCIVCGKSILDVNEKYYIYPEGVIHAGCHDTTSKVGAAEFVESVEPPISLKEALKNNIC